MKTILWEVRPTGAPTVVRYCRRCGAKTAFVSSGLFRVNVQQKNLDVWLVCKCAVCDTTWNMTVLSRVSPRSLAPELLSGFLQNDAALAARYAFDAALVRKNGAEPGRFEVEVSGEDCDLSVPCRVRLVSFGAAEVRLSAVLRQKLGLSRSAFDALCADVRLVCVSGHDLKKAKLGGEAVIEVR